MFCLSKIIFSRHCVGYHEKTNALFNRSNFCISIHKVSKSMKLYNFVSHFYPLYLSVFMIGMLNQQPSTCWFRTQFHSVAHDCFPILRPNFYNYNSFCPLENYWADNRFLRIYIYVRIHLYIHIWCIFIDQCSSSTITP